MGQQTKSLSTYELITYLMEKYTLAEFVDTYSIGWDQLENMTVYDWIEENRVLIDSDED